MMKPRWYPYLWTSLLSAALLAMAPGCGTWSGGRGHPIGEVHLFGVPNALSVTGSALPGGVGVRIYVSEAGGTRGVPIRDGRLEVLMFDRAAAGLDPRTEPPLKGWNFSPADLAPFRTVAMMGTGYTLQLNWGEDRPKGKVLTLIARYTGPGKTQIYSAPAVISVTTH